MIFYENFMIFFKWKFYDFFNDFIRATWAEKKSLKNHKTKHKKS